MKVIEVSNAVEETKDLLGKLNKLENPVYQ